MPLAQMPMSELAPLGWGPFFEEALAALAGTPGEVGRVRAQHRGGYEVQTGQRVLPAVVSGKTMRGWEGAELPLVGDWVIVEELASGGAVVRAMLPRKSKLSRRAAGGGVEEQSIVANVDVALLVTSLDQDFSPRRLERYAMVAHEGGARAVVVLTKADLCPDPAPFVAQAAAVVPGGRVIVVSAVDGRGLDELRALASSGETLVLLGSSGVGKSTITNALLGRGELSTCDVRSDGKGRHTTTHRHLVPLPGGGVLIDTPGMRELGVMASEEQAFEAFGEVEALTHQCRFSDCQHRREPGCALRLAVEAGTLAPERAAAYLKMLAEAAWVSAQQSARGRSESKARQRAGSKLVAEALKRKGR